MPKPKEQRPRVNAVEMERRLLQVQTWIIEGVTHGLMVNSILQNDWCGSKRHAERLISEGKKRWLQTEDEKISVRRNLQIQRLKHVARKIDPVYLKTPGGIRAILSVEKEINMLEGIRPTRLMIEAEIAKDQGKQADPLSTEESKLTIEALLPYGQHQALNTTNQSTSMS